METTKIIYSYMRCITFQISHFPRCIKPKECTQKLKKKKKIHHEIYKNAKMKKVMNGISAEERNMYNICEVRIYYKKKNKNGKRKQEKQNWKY